MLDTLNKIGAEIVDGLRANLQNYNRNASGNLSKSLRFEVSDSEKVSKLVVFGNSYIYYLEYGRGPTRGRSGTENFTVKKIEDWIVAKGLSYDIPLKSLAYLIWRKINREGYKATEGVISDTINPNSVSEYMRRVGGEVKNSMVKQIKDFIKNAS